MKDNEILDLFKKTNALLTGHFKLSSGLHSERYLQCALVLEHPEYANMVCGELAKKFKSEEPTVVIGPALGGVVVSYATANALGCRSIFTEREEGAMTLRRGFSIVRADRVLVVEDVITTGGSTKEVIDVVKKYGAAVIGVGAIVNRSSEDIDFGTKFESLIRVEVKTFRPEDCPMCKNSIPVVKPGSRR